MNTDLHIYRKPSCLITKRTTDKTIVADEYLNIQEKLWNFQNTSQGNKYRPTWPSIIKMPDKINSIILTYIYTYAYTFTSSIYHSPLYSGALNDDSATIFKKCVAFIIPYLQVLVQFIYTCTTQSYIHETVKLVYLHSRIRYGLISQAFWIF